MQSPDKEDGPIRLQALADGGEVAAHLEAAKDALQDQVLAALLRQVLAEQGSASALAQTAFSRLNLSHPLLQEAAQTLRELLFAEVLGRAMLGLSDQEQLLETAQAEEQERLHEIAHSLHGQLVETVAQQAMQAVEDEDRLLRRTMHQIDFQAAPWLSIRAKILEEVYAQWQHETEAALQQIVAERQQELLDQLTARVRDLEKEMTTKLAAESKRLAEEQAAFETTLAEKLAAVQALREEEAAAWEAALATLSAEREALATQLEEAKKQRPALPTTVAQASTAASEGRVAPASADRGAAQAAARDHEAGQQLEPIPASVDTRHDADDKSADSINPLLQEKKYIFGFSDSNLVEEAGIPGISSNHLVAAEAIGEVFVLNARVDDPRFEPEHLQEHLQDPAWRQQLRARHARVLEALTQRGVLLPAPIGTVVNTQAELAAYTHAQAAEVEAKLERLRGRAAWRLDVVCDLAQLKATIEDANQSVASQIQGVSESLTSYIEDAFATSHTLADRIQLLIRHVTSYAHRSVQAHAVEAKPPELGAVHGEPASSRVMRAWYLIDQEASGQVEVLSEELENRFSRLGFSFSLIGPKPPLHFV